MNKRLLKTIGVVFVMLIILCVMPAEKAEAKALALNKKTITVTKGKTRKIWVKNLPGSKKVTWSSSKKSIAGTKKVSRTTVKITGVKRGTCYVYAKVKGRKRLRCKVRVIQPKLKQTSVTVSKGSTVTISFQDGNVTWKSSDASIAKISSKTSTYCKVKGVKTGKTTIKAVRGKKTYTCIVTVKKASYVATPDPYVIKITPVCEYGHIPAGDGAYIEKIPQSLYKEVYGCESLWPMQLRIRHEGKAYYIWELPRNTEISAIRRNNSILNDFLTNYLDKYKAEMKDKYDDVVIGLTAVHRFMYDQGWKYVDQENELKNDGGDLSRLLIFKTGVCSSYSKTFQYLCYLAGVDCCVAVTGGHSPHAINLVKYKNRWYAIEPQNFDDVGQTGFNVDRVDSNNVSHPYFYFAFDGYKVCMRGYGNNVDDLSYMSTVFECKTNYGLDEKGEKYNHTAKTASGIIPTTAELMDTTGTEELPVVIMESFEYSAAYMLKVKKEEEIAAQTKYEICDMSKNPLTDLSLKPTEYKYLQLLKIYPKDGVTKYALISEGTSWSVSDPNVLYFKTSTEKLTAIAPGEATLTVTYGDITRSITVTVTE